MICAELRLDSTTIVSFMSELLKADVPDATSLRGQLKTFSAVFDGDPIDEREYIETAVESTGADTTYTNPTSHEFIGELRDFRAVEIFRGGAIPASSGDATIAAQVGETISVVLSAFERFEFSKALESIWGLLSAADKFIVEQAPWKLVKKPEAAAALDSALYTAAEVLRIACLLLYPVIPSSVAKIFAPRLVFRSPGKHSLLSQLPFHR